MAKIIKKTEAFVLVLKFIVCSFLPEEMDRKHLIRISRSRGKLEARAQDYGLWVLPCISSLASGSSDFGQKV
jgi:hypothetical protein